MRVDHVRGCSWSWVSHTLLCPRHLPVHSPAFIAPSASIVTRYCTHRGTRYTSKAPARSLVRRFLGPCPVGPVDGVGNIRQMNSLDQASVGRVVEDHRFKRADGCRQEDG